MKAMLLAAGKGKRMRPLTLTISKVLLEVGGAPLIEHHIVRLRDAGITDLVINVHHFAEQVMQHLGNGSSLGVVIEYSREFQPLETAGGLKNALKLLGDQPFLVVNADIYTDYPFTGLLATDLASRLGHLVMVDNPRENPGGDFGLAESTGNQPRLLSHTAEPKYTYSGISVLQPALLEPIRGAAPLRPLMDTTISSGLFSGEVYTGLWTDVGTPERLARLNAQLG